MPQNPEQQPEQERYPDRVQNNEEEGSREGKPDWDKDAFEDVADVCPKAFVWLGYERYPRRGVCVVRSHPAK